jgi:hypothetical protein
MMSGPPLRHQWNRSTSSKDWDSCFGMPLDTIYPPYAGTFT